jgi:hypothetical protein
MAKKFHFNAIVHFTDKEFRHIDGDFPNEIHDDLINMNITLVNENAAYSLDKKLMTNKEILNLRSAYRMMIREDTFES